MHPLKAGDRVDVPRVAAVADGIFHPEGELYEESVEAAGEGAAVRLG